MKNEVKFRWGTRLSELLPQPADVLELGPANGKPIGRILAERHKYTAIEIMEERVTRLKRALPQATVLNADYTTVALPPESFDAVVATYTFRQIGKDELVEMLDRVETWLRPGGYLLTTVGNRYVLNVRHPLVRRVWPGSSEPDDLLRRAGLTLVDYEFVEPTAREKGRLRRGLMLLAQKQRPDSPVSAPV